MKSVYFLIFVFYLSYCLAQQCGPNGCRVPNSNYLPQRYARPQIRSYPQQSFSGATTNNISRDNSNRKEDGDPNAKPVPIGPDGYPNPGPLQFKVTDPEPPHTIPDVTGVPSLGQLRSSPLSSPFLKDWLIDPVTEKVVRMPGARSNYRWKPDPAQGSDELATLTQDNPGVRADLYIASQRCRWPFLDNDFPPGTSAPPEIAAILERDTTKAIQWTKAAAMPRSNTVRQVFSDQVIPVPDNFSNQSNNQSIQERLNKLETKMEELLSILKR